MTSNNIPIINYDFDTITDYFNAKKLGDGGDTVDYGSVTQLSDGNFITTWGTILSNDLKYIQALNTKYNEALIKRYQIDTIIESKGAASTSRYKDIFRIYRLSQKTTMNSNDMVILTHLEKLFV